MENKKKKNVLYLILYILSILVVYVSSLQSGDVSANESSWMTNFFFQLITSLDFLKIDIDYDVLHNLVRKVFGHYGWFFVIGVFGAATFISFMQPKKRIWVSLAIGAFVAITAELMQFFAINRGPMASDMLINFSGYFTSTLLCFAILSIRNQQLSQKK
ncbi:MAG: VanZ family protein [Bacilli bacterium]|jgi:VanZ family protein|nr:VanZ family protein [Bacilli bacterium]MDD4056395.1 VanZ family protein [Bacilli bacterium]